MLEWLDAEPGRQVVDEAVDKAFDVLVEQYC